MVVFFRSYFLVGVFVVLSYPVRSIRFAYLGIRDFGSSLSQCLTTEFVSL